MSRNEDSPNLGSNILSKKKSRGLLRRNERMKEREGGRERRREMKEREGGREGRKRSSPWPREEESWVLRRKVPLHQLASPLVLTWKGPQHLGASPPPLPWVLCPLFFLSLSPSVLLGSRPLPLFSLLMWFEV